MKLRFILLRALLLPFIGALAATAQSLAPAPMFGIGERVLFQGDSITDMGRGRTADPNHLLGHGYAFLVAARYAAAYPERAVVFINRGVSGNTVADLAARWKTDTLDNRPDVLSVLIGINDIYFSMMSGKPLNVPAIEARYDELLTAAYQQNPKIKFILYPPRPAQRGALGCLA
jgi:lysophospholipase L1-like esterase